MKLRNCAIGFAILLGGCALALKVYKAFLNKQRNESNSDISVTSVDTSSLSDSDSDSSVASLSNSLSSLDSFASSAENNISRSPSYSASASAVQSDLDSKNSDFDSLNHLSKNKPSFSSSATSQSTSSQSNNEHDDSGALFMDGLQGIEKPSFDASDVSPSNIWTSLINNLSAFDDNSEQAKSSSEPDSLRSLSNNVSSTKDEVDSLSNSSDNTRNSTSYSVSVNKNGKPRITLKDRGQNNNNLFGNVCSDHIIAKLGSDYLKGLKEIANKQFKHISTSELEKIFHLDYYHAQFLTYRLWRFYVINSHSNTYSPKGENDLDPLNLIQYIDCIESNESNQD